MNSMRGLVLILFISHFLGDYYLQTDKMAESKEIKHKDLFLHFLIHLALSSVLVFIFYGSDYLIIPIIVSFAHMAIDFIKGKIKPKYQNSKFSIYALDQLLHIVSIIVIAYIFANKSSLVFNLIIESFLNDFSIDTAILTEKILAIIILIKPASISVSLFLEGFDYGFLDKDTLNKSDDNKGKQIGLKNAGHTIGVLERLIIYSLASAGQFAAIGFILTAKSITRYGKISEDAAFGEYYLIGTLFSLMLVIPLVLIL